jgi:hypothetical protein
LRKREEKLPILAKKEDKKIAEEITTPHVVDPFGLKLCFFTFFPPSITIIPV